MTKVIVIFFLSKWVAKLNTTNGYEKQRVYLCLM